MSGHQYEDNIGHTTISQSRKYEVSWEKPSQLEPCSQVLKRAENQDEIYDEQIEAPAKRLCAASDENHFVDLAASQTASSRQDRAAQQSTLTRSALTVFQVRRRMHIIFSPTLAPGCCDFNVETSGLSGVLNSITR